MAQYSVYRPWSGDPWLAFDALRREMDSALGRLGTPFGRPGAFPAANLYETEEAYVLTAELPGVSPDDIEVSLQGQTVTLRGERKIEHADGETAVHRTERQSGSFRRAFELPDAIDAEKVEAMHRNGVLILRLPKSAEQKPRTITVQAG